MSRKIYAMLLPVLAVVAFAAVPAVASASKVYGACGGAGSSVQCPTGQAFTEFTLFGESVAAKKMSTSFVLKAGEESITCTALVGGGAMWNEGSPTVGHSHIVLRFGKCTAAGAVLGAACTAAKPINGNETIEGVVTDTVTKEGNPANVTIKIESGFPVECGGTLIGTVSGTAVGEQAEKKSILAFSGASGLSFAGKASTITGEVEFLTVGGLKVYI